MSLRNREDDQLAVNQQLAQAIQALTLIITNNDDHPSESRRRAKKPELPEFDGKFGTAAKDWTEQVDRAIVSGFVTSREVTRALPFLFTGDALAWYSHLPEETRSPTTSWDDWKVTIHHKFLEARTWAMALHELTNRKLRASETVHQFVRDKEKLYREVFEANINLEHLKQLIVHETPLEWQLHLGAAFEDYTVDQIVHRLAQLDENFPRAKLKDAKYSPNGSTKQHSIPIANTTKSSATSSPARNTVRPPFPCPACNGDHWKSDCLQEQKRSSMDTPPRKTFGEMKDANSASFPSNAPSPPAHNSGTNHRYLLRSRQQKPTVSFATTHLTHSPHDSSHSPPSPPSHTHSSNCPAPTNHNHTTEDF